MRPRYPQTIFYSLYIVKLQFRRRKTLQVKDYFGPAFGNLQITEIDMRLRLDLWLDVHETVQVLQELKLMIQGAGSSDSPLSLQPKSDGLHPNSVLSHPVLFFEPLVASLLLVVRPRAPIVASLFLVATPFAPSVLVLLVSCRSERQVFTGLRVLFWAVVLLVGCMYLLGVVTRTVCADVLLVRQLGGLTGEALESPMFM